MTLSKIPNSQRPRKLSNPANKRLTPIAHAVRFAMKCGVTSVADLARELECSRSAIYRAMKQIRENDATVTETDRTVTSDATVSTVRSQNDATVTETDRTVTSDKERVSPHTPLPKETPACMQQQPAGIQEIEGLNGSTPKLVSQFARLLAGPLGTPDPETAFDLLAGNVELYGAERVKIGFLEFQQKMASEPRVRDPLKLFNGFMKGARLPKADDPKGEYAAIDRQFARLRREHEKPLEAISYGF